MSIRHTKMVIWLVGLFGYFVGQASMASHFWANPDEVGSACEYTVMGIVLAAVAFAVALWVARSAPE